HDGLLPPDAAAPPGAVRLAADGSVAAFVPAGRALTWQLAQPDGTAVVRERYWVTFAAGEIRVCTHCHGINRTDPIINKPPPPSPSAPLRQLACWWRGRYDDGATPLPSTPTPTATATVPPTATIVPVQVSGHVRYYRDDRPVAGVQLAGDTTSTAAGAFAISAAPGANLLLTPRRSGAGRAVSALDAA